MNKDRGRKLEAVRRAYDVARQYAPESPPERFTTYVANVAEALSAADAAAAAARAAPLRSHTATVRSARDALVTTLRVFRDIGVGMDFDTPGTRYTLNMTRAAEWRQESLLQVAGQLLTIADQHAAEFTANGAPPDRLRSAIAAFKTAVTQRTEARASQRSAAEALVVALRQCDRSVAQLHGVMQAIYTTDPTVMTAWNAAHKIGARPTRKGVPKMADGTGQSPKMPLPDRLTESTAASAPLAKVA